MLQSLKKSFFSFLGTVLVCALAFLGPRLYFRGKEDLEFLRTRLNLPLSSSKEKQPLTLPPIEVSSAPAYTGSAEYKSAPTTPIEEMFRFDWTPARIVERWPRVSAAMPELHLQGYRTAAVTGGEIDDLAGSVTYYFDSDEVKKITFRGSTGDFRKLTRWLGDHYGFEQRPTKTPGVYVYEETANPSLLPRGGAAKSYLWIRPAQVFVDDKPMTRFDLTLVLERP